MEPFKNHFSPQLVTCLAGHLERELKGFKRQAFETDLTAALPALELKQRVQLIADRLHEVLPASLPTRYRVLRAILHPDADARLARQSDADGMCGWGMLPLSAVVGQYGLADFEASLFLLKEMTSRFSSEFDVRYYLLANQNRALSIMRTWAQDPSQHVRRLVSEGTRPRLPWAMQLPALKADPTPLLPILEVLRDDEEEYVRRSVANSLNDIAKDHPDLVASLAKQWLRGGGDQRRRLLRHACRSLIKQGHAQALAAFGLLHPQIKLTKLLVETPTVTLGGALIFTADLRATASNTQTLVIDYVVYFLKANGSRVGKVFKWKTLTIAPQETVSLRRSHPIRLITTRRYYAGPQALSLRINGADMGSVEFILNIDLSE